MKAQKLKDFGRYFWNTIKEAKYLLFKYVGTAILMCIIAVLANLLQVKELTYLNAVLAINCFSSLISFGIGESIGTMVNQSINSKYRVKKYVKIGNELNMIFMALFTVFLVAFPKFIMQTITGFIPDNYTFYYLMCLDFFLCGLKEYLIEILKQLQIYKLQFFSESLTYILVVLGFAVLYGAGIYYLNWIALVYIFAICVTIVVCLIVLLKNKVVSINILLPEKIKLTAAQWKLILLNLGVEFVWQIGYFAISVLLLRMSDAMLNTYSYLENVLDVFNGVFYAFVNVTCVRIARSLGRNKFDRAQMHAKYSIFGTLIIWAFYFISTMVLIYPISLGVNKQYFSLMFSVVPCYALLALLRFVIWNFSSYMLRLGGKNTVHFVLEIIETLVFIGLCFIARFLPDNIFLCYFIIALPDICALPVYIFLYKKKDWIANVNDDPNLLKNKVKCFIFDFDDTLYYGVKIDAYQDLALNFFNEHFGYKSEEERRQILKKYGCGKHGKDVYRHIKEILMDFEGTSKAWTDFHTGLEVQPEAKAGRGVSMRELKKCCKLGNLYIVSNSHITEIQQRAKMYGIDLDIFKKIYSNDDNSAEKEKGEFYKKIMKSEGLKPENILVVGDKYKTDLLPAKELEMNIYKTIDGFTFEELVG